MLQSSFPLLLLQKNIFPKQIFYFDIKLFSSRILDEYKNRVRMGKIEDDSYQTAVIDKLLILDEQLKNYNPSVLNGIFKNNFILSRFKYFQSFSKTNNEQLPNFRGLYLHGSVGCGKTMLMDLFFDNCCVNSQFKRRIHFHSFMIDIHNRIYQYKQNHQNISKYDPITDIAKEIVDQCWLLCLDEFQVTDVGDAMILKNFFKALFNHGMVMIATSNRPPDELYKNGIQRSNFLPFIPLLKKYCDIYELKSGIDYRRLVNSKKHQVYYVIDEDTDKTLDLLFKVMANAQNDIVHPQTLNIKGRNITLKKTCGSILDSSFSELCDQPFGAIDYLTISQYYSTIIIRNVPKLTIKLRSQARRFITMIDTFYDHNVRILISSDVPSDKLFQVQRIDNVLHDDDNRKLMDDLGMGMNSTDLNASIFSGEEEMFAFERALSRLYEMQTASYWNRKVEDDK